MTIPHIRASAALLIAASVAVLQLAGSTAAQAATPPPALTAASAPQLIPVWAYVNGADPVAGGRVVIIAGGKPVRQLSPRPSGQTNANGVALVSVRRVPGRFTVIVQGGRADGRRLMGSLRSLVGSDPEAGVVEVNPLTSLITELRRQRPRLGFGQASRSVKRYFGVPWWADLGQNLRDGPRWFAAGWYLTEVARYGSIDLLNRSVARRILRDRVTLKPTRGGVSLRQMSQSARFKSATATAGLSAATRTARAAVFGLTAGQLVVKVFKFLGSTTLGAGAHALVGGVFGGLLELVQKAGVELPKSEFEQVSGQLSALGAQVTQLQGQVSKLDARLAHDTASTLIHHSDDVLKDIKHATGQLEALAEADGTAGQRANLAARITKYIGDHLLQAPATLDLHLNPEVALGDNAIKATSRALAKSSRFFDARQSHEVRAVYDYFATYQAQLAVLLTNYWNAHPATFSVDYTQKQITKLETSVTETQQKSLKPTVPVDTFMDTKTPRFMWAAPQRRVTGGDVLKENLQTSTTISPAVAQGRFHNFQMPSPRDLEILLEGATGNPHAWLGNQVQVNLAHQLIWDSVSIRRVPVDDLQVTIFDLATARQEQYLYGGSKSIAPAPQCFQQVFSGCVLRDRRLHNFVYSKGGGLLLLRYLAPGESYWW